MAGGGGVPTTHTLGSSGQQSIAALHYFSVAFTLPVQAGVAFDVIDQGTNDTWTVGIFTPNDWSTFQQGGQVSAMAAHDDVSTISDTATLDASDWLLGLRCDNLIFHCPMSLDLSATY